MTKNIRKSKTKKSENIRVLVHFLRSSALTFIFSVIAAAAMSLAEMINPQIIRVTVDNVIGGETEISPISAFFVEKLGGVSHIAENLWIAALAIIVAATLQVITIYLYRTLNAKASERLIKTMRDDLYGHIARLPFSWHAKNQTGDIIQRCTSDIETTRRFISEQLSSMFRIVLLLVMSLTFMFSMNVGLTLIAIAPLPIIIGYSFVFHKNIKNGFEKCDENEGKLSAMAQENLTGVRVVRAFGREAYEKEKFEAQNKYYTSLWVKLAKVMSRFWSLSDVISGLQIMFIVVFGAVFCINGDLKSGEFIAFISYNIMLVWPMRRLGQVISEMSKAGVSISRISYIMNSPVEKDKDDACEPPLDGDIVFDNVSFAYENCPEILHNISFEIKAGSVLGIIGGTGSGKSTLMLLLDRLYDLPEENGKITIGGVDIRDMKAEHLRSGVGMVLQEPFLFSRSIKDNIGITKDGITLSDIREAAEAACLDETVNNFSKGYETFVGERGVTLSGGQKQRAAIARMLTQKTPIMIFDDSLSAVDTETDAKIRRALEARFGTATTIIISHRITTLSKADMIIVLDKGRIIEKGTHEKLKTAGGIYEKIYDIQSGGIEEAEV
ncbi:MAG: ABC transporter ATP-binding protein [Clostridia bacterium]|nr:ABC transporter ATP-binding protein [Clostridia bacterium]